MTDLNTVQGNVEKGVDYEVSPVTLSFRGWFASVFSLIKQIESMRRLVRINELELG